MRIRISSKYTYYIFDFYLMSLASYSTVRLYNRYIRLKIFSNNIIPNTQMCTFRRDENAHDFPHIMQKPWSS